MDKDDAMQIDDSSAAVKRKGRGFRGAGGGGGAGPDARPSQAGAYDRLADDTSAAGNAARSVEGWVVIVKGVHEDATEEDLQDKFADYGHVMNLIMPLDRRTGYVKGYALVEYETRKEAEACITDANGSQLLERTLECDFAFVRGPDLGGARTNKPRVSRGRSHSPSGRKAPLVNRID